MKRNKLIRVVKRDGNTEAFDFGKLRRSVSAAMKATGYDPAYADALAKAVAIHVREWDEHDPPTTEYLFTCVRSVLEETGLGDVAQAIVRHRRHRASRRSSISVIDPRRPQRPPSAWSKGRIVETFERRYQVKPDVSRFLAGEIEQRLLALGYHVVSTALVAELIRNELMAWGLSDDAIAVRSAADAPGTEAPSGAV